MPSSARLRGARCIKGAQCVPMRRLTFPSKNRDNCRTNWDRSPLQPKSNQENRIAKMRSAQAGGNFLALGCELLAYRTREDIRINTVLTCCGKQSRSSPGGGCIAPSVESETVLRMAFSSPRRTTLVSSATRKVPKKSAGALESTSSVRNVCLWYEAVCASGRRREYREQSLPAPARNVRAGPSIS